MVFYESLYAILEPIVKGKNGVIIKVGDEMRTCIPVVPFCAVDEKESYFITGVNFSWNANRPCTNCLHKPK